MSKTDSHEIRIGEKTLAELDAIAAANRYGPAATPDIKALIARYAPVINTKGMCKILRAAFPDYKYNKNNVRSMLYRARVGRTYKASGQSAKPEGILTKAPTTETVTPCHWTSTKTKSSRTPREEASLAVITCLPRKKRPR